MLPFQEREKSPWHVRDKQNTMKTEQEKRKNNKVNMHELKQRNEAQSWIRLYVPTGYTINL